MPLRTSFLRTRFSAKEADWPAEQRGTGMRLRSMERMLVVRNWPRESGPTRMASPEWMMPLGLLGAEVGGGRLDLPLFTTPEMTVPTKGTEKVSLMWNSKGALSS